jgi:hypothetical protein
MVVEEVAETGGRLGFGGRSFAYGLSGLARQATSTMYAMETRYRVGEVIGELPKSSAQSRW